MPFYRVRTTVISALKSSMGRIGGALPPFRTRRYVQDVRYFAIEHMDVRREAVHVGSSATSLSLTVLKRGSTPPLLRHH
jgi:hypothetical protein